MTEIVREEIEALCERDNCVGNGVRLAQAALQLLKLTDAQAAKIAKLEAALDEARKCADKIYANLEAERAKNRQASKQISALNSDIASLESERDQLRKQVEGRVDWMRRASDALKPFANEAVYFDDIPGVYRCDDDVEIWQKPTYRYKITVGDLRRARELSAASALEQKEQG